MKRNLAIILVLILVLSSFTYAFANNGNGNANPNALENSSKVKDNQGNSQNAPGQNKDDSSNDQDGDQGSSGNSETAPGQNKDKVKIDDEETPGNPPDNSGNNSNKSDKEENNNVPNTQIHVMVTSGSEYIKDIYVSHDEWPQDLTLNRRGGSSTFVAADNNQYVLDDLSKIVVITEDDIQVFEPAIDYRQGQEGGGTINYRIQVEGPEDPEDPSTTETSIYALTVNYIKEDEEVPFDSYNDELDENTDYLVTSPAIEGYTTDQTSVSGTITTDTSIDVIYTKINSDTEATYTVTLNASPTTAGAVAGEGNYEAGKTVTITAQGMEGYKFEEWIDSNDIQITTQSVYVFEMPAENLTYTAVFVSEIAGENGGGTERDSSGGGDPDPDTLVEEVTILNSEVETPEDAPSKEEDKTEETKTEEIPEDQLPQELPETGVLPVELFYGLGVLLSGAGALVSKKK